MNWQYNGNSKYSGGKSARAILSDGRQSPCTFITRDEQIQTDYLAMPYDFTASVFSPVVSWKGQPVGRAFERDSDGRYTFLLCNEYGKIGVSLRRDLWEAYFSDNLVLEREEIFGRYVDLIVQEEGEEFKFQTNIHQVTDLKKYVDSVVTDFAATANSRKSTMNRLIEESLASAKMSTPYIADHDRRAFLESAILVDGIYYGPFGTLNEDGTVLSSNGYDTLGQVFRQEKLDGKLLTKFVLVGRKPYLALPWWNTEVFGGDLAFNNWTLFRKSDLKEYHEDQADLGYAVDRPKPDIKFTLVGLKDKWTEKLAAPTRNLWTKYLGDAIKVNGMPAIRLHWIEEDFQLQMVGDRLQSRGTTVATLFDSTQVVPLVRLNNEVFVPVEFLGGVKLDKGTGKLTIPHSDTINTSVDLRTFSLKEYAVAELKRQDQQRLSQVQQTAARQAAAAQQRAQAQQQAQKDAAVAAAALASQQRAEQDRLNKDIQVVKKAAPGMSVTPLGPNLFGAFKLNNYKLQIKLFQLKAGKVAASCYQQTRDGLHVTSINTVRGQSGALYVTFATPAGLGTVAYTFAPNYQVCGFTVIR